MLVPGAGCMSNTKAIPNLYGKYNLDCKQEIMKLYS